MAKIALSQGCLWNSIFRPIICNKWE